MKNELEKNLLLSEVKYRRLFETAQDGILLLDYKTGKITDANPFILKMLNYTKKQLVGKALWEIGAFKDIANSKKALNELKKKKYIRYENKPLQKKGNGLMYVEFISNVYSVGSNKVIQCNIRDISKRKESENALLISESKYQRLFETAQDGILLLDYKTGKITDANPFILKMLNYTKKQLVGKALWEIGAFKDIANSKKALNELKKKKYIRYEDKPLQKKGNGLMYVEFINNVYSVGSNKVIQCHIRDITERKQIEAQLNHIATFDFLTELPNRRFFNIMINKEISRAIRHNSILAIFFMDIDKFKEVNDTYGHDIGDLLLQKAGDRLQKNIRKEDFIARIGGDEFAFILFDTKKTSEIATIAKKLINNMRRPFNIRGHKIAVTISIGISFFPHDGKNRLKLLKKADIALYKAKYSGGGDYKFSS